PVVPSPFTRRFKRSGITNRALQSSQHRPPLTGWALLPPYSSIAPSQMEHFMKLIESPLFARRSHNTRFTRHAMWPGFFHMVRFGGGYSARLRWNLNAVCDLAARRNQRRKNSPLPTFETPDQGKITARHPCSFGI